MNLFKGVTIHEQYMKDKPKGMSDDEYVVRQTLSTDFALNFARNVFCTRLPIKREMVPAMVNYLNSLNDKYHSGESYEWSVVSNNCVHTAHNTIAAAGILEHYETDQNILKQAFNLAIPGNEYVSLERMGNDDSLDDVVSIYQDPYKRKALLEHDWMATQPGVLTDFHAIHQLNSLYDTDSDIMIVDGLPTRPNRSAFEDFKHVARYSDMRANLLYFKDKYQSALQSRLSIEELQEIADSRARGSAIAPLKLNTPEFKRFYDAYYLKIEKSLRDVEQKLSQLGE
jgi:hypothetical protein